VSRSANDAPRQRIVAIAEILPGVHHWTAQHPRQRFTVSSYWLDDGGVEHVLLAHGEPMLGDGGEQLRQLIADGGQTARDAFA
jgi:hypothetical protein